MAESAQPPTRCPSSELSTANAEESSIDHALTLLLADETEAALRWGAAALQRDPSTSSALMVTSRLLERLGRTRSAIEGLRTAAQRAVEAGNLPLAIAAIDELRALGEDVGDLFDHVSETFCDSSPRLDERTAPLSSHVDDFQPLSSFLAGPALASRVAQLVHAAATHATDADDGTEHDELPLVARLPLFSALPKDALRDLLGAFDVITVPAGHRIMEEGEPGAAAYVVARGEVVLSRTSGAKPPIVLARLGSGAFFGEMALLSDMPRAAAAVAARPSILLVATREALDAVARRHPIVAVELAAHCHRRLVANLGRMAPILATLPPAERAVIMDKFVTRIYAKGERLASKGEEIGGLHLLSSGAVAVVAHDENERIVLATLSTGETIGEVELVLCRRANADAIALQPTVTLFLSRVDFASLVLDHPALVHGLYVSAVRRDGETAQALESATFTANEYQLDEIIEEGAHAVEEKPFESFTETGPSGTTTADDVPELPVTAHATSISVPPALPSMPAPAEEPARGASVTAPFPPVFVPQDARLEIVEEPAPAAFSVRAALEESPKSASTSRFSSVSPLIAASVPPRGSTLPAPRSRLFWELPPAAVLGVFAAVAVVGFALAAPFSNHANTSAASGGEQNVSAQIEPSLEPHGPPAPESQPVVEAPPAPPSALAATKAVPPAPRARSVAATRIHSAAPAATANEPPPASSSAGTAAPSAIPTVTTASMTTVVVPHPERRTAGGAPPAADEFGGRE